VNWQLKQAIKRAKKVRLIVTDSDGIYRTFYISKKNAMAAYENELFFGIDYLNEQSDGTQFEFDEKGSGFLEIINVNVVRIRSQKC